MDRRYFPTLIGGPADGHAVERGAAGPHVLVVAAGRDEHRYERVDVALPGQMHVMFYVHMEDSGSTPSRRLEEAVRRLAAGWPAL